VIRLLEVQVGETVDLGWVDVDTAVVRRYWDAVGLRVPLDRRQLPLGLALALRGMPRPGVELAADVVSVHAGHTLVAHRPFVGGRRYRLLARIAEIFEKSGRSGPLTVVARSSELRDEADAAVVTVREQQIVRWRGSPTAPRPILARPTLAAPPTPWAAIDLGATVAVEHRLAPDARLVRGYAGSLSGVEPLFSDADFARRLGFADVIVPGPVQSALLESLLVRSLPRWDVVELSLSFRVSVIAAEPITLTALVTEIDECDQRLVVDLTLENSHGERAAVGTATLLKSGHPAGEGQGTLVPS
jgi:hydroxyacyl-ACP dehydratase HTD2-like protein with hotdog domain